MMNKRVKWLQLILEEKTNDNSYKLVMIKVLRIIDNFLFEGSRAEINFKTIFAII